MEHFTKQETVISLALQGVKAPEIAQITGLSYNYVKNILSKNDIKTRNIERIYLLPKQKKIYKAISLTEDVYNKLQSLEGKDNKEKITKLIKESKNYNYLDLKPYLREFKEVKNKKEIRVTLSKEVYHKALNIKFNESVNFSFLIWFLIKTEYIK